MAKFKSYIFDVQVYIRKQYFYPDPRREKMRGHSARTKTSALLTITFVDMTYPKGWTGSLPLCPLIFSCPRLFHFESSFWENINIYDVEFNQVGFSASSWTHTINRFIKSR